MHSWLKRQKTSDPDVFVQGAICAHGAQIEAEAGGGRHETARVWETRNASGPNCTVWTKRSVVVSFREDTNEGHILHGIAKPARATTPMRK
jgi:hypothetical protein